MKLTLLHKLLFIALVGVLLLWAIPRWLGDSDADGGGTVTGQAPSQP